MGIFEVASGRGGTSTQKTGLEEGIAGIKMDGLPGTGVQGARTLSVIREKDRLIKQYERAKSNVYPDIELFCNIDSTCLPLATYPNLQLNMLWHSMSRTATQCIPFCVVLAMQPNYLWKPKELCAAFAALHLEEKLVQPLVLKSLSQLIHQIIANSLEQRIMRAR